MKQYYLKHGKQFVHFLFLNLTELHLSNFLFYRSRDATEWGTSLLLSPETRYSQDLTSKFFYIKSNTVILHIVYSSCTLLPIAPVSFLPTLFFLMLSFCSPLKAQVGSLSPPLSLLPPRARSPRCVSFSHCLPTSDLCPPPNPYCITLTPLFQQVVVPAVGWRGSFYPS